MINNALDSYEKCTRKDLRTDLLAIRLQSCDFLGAILVVLQQQLQVLGQSRNTDERWMEWLNLTVNVCMPSLTSLEQMLAWYTSGHTLV